MMMKRAERGQCLKEGVISLWTKVHGLEIRWIDKSYGLHLWLRAKRL